MIEATESAFFSVAPPVRLPDAPVADDDDDSFDVEDNFGFDIVRLGDSPC